MYSAFLFCYFSTAVLLSGFNGLLVSGSNPGDGTRMDPRQTVGFRPIIQAIFSFGSGCPGLKSKVAKMTCSHTSENLSQGIDCTKSVPRGTKVTFTCPTNTVISEKYSSITCGSPAKRKWSGKVVRCKAEVVTTTTAATTLAAVVDTTLGADMTSVSDDTTTVGSEETTLPISATDTNSSTVATILGGETVTNGSTTISF